MTAVFAFTTAHALIKNVSSTVRNAERETELTAEPTDLTVRRGMETLSDR